MTPVIAAFALVWIGLMLATILAAYFGGQK